MNNIEAADIQLRPYNAGDEEHILMLFENAFQRQMTLNYWHWRFRENPLHRTAIELAWYGNTLVSHYAVSLVEAEIQGQRIMTALAGTTMTHTSFRGLNLFQSLGKQLYARLKQDGVKLVWGFPNNKIHRSRVKHLGWFNIYEVPTFRVHLDRATYNYPPSVVEIQDIDSRFDDLWKVAKSRYNVIGTRSASQLKWRYIKNPIEQYRIVGVPSNSTLLGYAVYKQYHNELQIVDILTADDEQIGVPLVNYVMAKAAELRLASVSMWLNVFSDFHLSLEKWGFHNDVPITYFGGRVIDSEDMDINVAKDYGSWHITMGDSDVY